MAAQLLGLGSALLVLYLGLTRQALQGLGGAAIAGLSLIMSAVVFIDLGTPLAAIETFPVMLCILAFWYGVGLFVNWGWRKVTDAP